MQFSRRVLSPRTPLALLQPQLAQFSRQASLTSAINRGIRKSRGLGSLESRSPARPPRKTRQDPLQGLTRRTGIGFREDSRRSSEDGFSQKSRDNKYSGERYGRNRELPKWQARSGKARGGGQARGS